MQTSAVTTQKQSHYLHVACLMFVIISNYLNAWSHQRFVMRVPDSAHVVGHFPRRILEKLVRFKEGQVNNILLTLGPIPIGPNAAAAL